jgi:mono/diheme cytochrome c family protein
MPEAACDKFHIALSRCTVTGGLGMRVVAQIVVGIVGMTLAAGAASGQDKAQVDRGMQVYTAQKCNVCHSIAGKGNKKGPLDSVGTKLTADEIREWIVNAPEMAKKAKAPARKPPMKSYPKLPKEDVDGLVGYLQTSKQA